MNVELMNAEEVKNLFRNWGETSKICYATETDEPEKIGKGCMYSGHFSGSRGDYIKFLVTDVPRFAVDQAVRHEVGVFKNVGSFRYISKDSFAYEVPVEITDNKELVDKYVQHMSNTAALYDEIKEYVLSKGTTRERACEQARYVLPMATHTSFVIGFTVEGLVHFCNSRLCVRAENIIRKMARLMRDEVLKVLPELKARLVPNCQWMLYCPEGKKSCGAYPTRKELKEIIENART